MAKQVSRFKFYGNRTNSNNHAKPINKCSDVESNVTREDKLLLKKVVQNMVARECNKKKSESNENYTLLKHNEWEK